MIDRLTLGHDARSPQLCAKPLPVEHVFGTIAFRLRFGGVLRGRFVPRTWFDFDRVPAGTVLAGTRLFRTRSDYKKWCVPSTENMFPLELYREQVWTPGVTTPHSDNCPPGQFPTRTIPPPGQLPTRTTPHQDHYKPIKPLIRTNTCTVGNCPGGELTRWGVDQIRLNLYPTVPTFVMNLGH